VHGQRPISGQRPPPRWSVPSRTMSRKGSAPSSTMRPTTRARHAVPYTAGRLTRAAPRPFRSRAASEMSAAATTSRLS